MDRCLLSCSIVGTLKIFIMILMNRKGMFIEFHNDTAQKACYHSAIMNLSIEINME